MTLTVRSWALILAWFGLGLLGESASAQPTARWVGQDGHDFVGTYANAAKSGIQDLHFTLAGLSPRSKIVSAVVRGEGDGEWKFNGPPNSWLALIVTRPGGAAADVYVEPYRIEPGRQFDFHLTFADNRTVAFSCRGGKADPNLRMPGTGIEVRWIGQDRQDRAGPSPNVGPDGVQDVHLGLSKLTPKEEIRSILIAGPGDLRWQFGTNHEAHTGIEQVRNTTDPTRADLYFHPVRDLAGQTLKITLTYANGKTDSATVTGGKTDPALKLAPAVAPRLNTVTVKSTWLGQGPAGDVRVRLDGLPAYGRLDAAFLSDGVVGGWSDRAGQAGWLPLAFHRGANASQAELTFPPLRDETGATMTVRLVYGDGRSAIATFPGGPCDPSLRAPAPEASTVQVKPGDDLNDLANRFGTVNLAAGTYSLSHPLILNRPVTITSAGGATLVFSQAASDPAWTAAIKIHAGRTTLDRLAIRFAGPVRWDHDVSYGPAVIGTTDNRDKPTGNVVAGLAFTRLDVQGPPPSTAWEEAPKSLRLINATNGVIEANVLKGGTIECFGGPWRLLGNKHDGTPAGSFTYVIASIHSPHDVLVARNRVKPLDPAGKSWRWLVLTNSGANVRVADNVVEHVGPRDDDTHEHPNSPENVLTESYKLTFEGKTTGTWFDGRVIGISAAQGEAATVGSVVSILSGPQAGEWRRVVMPIGPNSFLLDRPVALGGGAISISPGFVDTSFENNTIDARGSKIAMPFVLAGQHFGTKLIKNHTYGGVESFRIFASGSEVPVHWGWSHNPMFGLVFDGNTFEDGWDGAFLGVHHEPLIRATRGRVYMTATLTNNTFVRSEAFLSAHRQAKRGKPPVALLLGWRPSGDPGEFIVNESGNHRQGGPPGPSILVHMTTLNGRAIKDAPMSFADQASAKAGANTSIASPRR